MKSYIRSITVKRGVKVDVMLIILSIIGEYIGRIYDKTKRRPLYIARDVYERKADGKGKHTYAVVYE